MHAESEMIINIIVFYLRFAPTGWCLISQTTRSGRAFSGVAFKRFETSCQALLISVSLLQVLPRKLACRLTLSHSTKIFKDTLSTIMLASYYYHIFFILSMVESVWKLKWFSACWPPNVYQVKQLIKCLLWKHLTAIMWHPRVTSSCCCTCHESIGKQQQRSETCFLLSNAYDSTFLLYGYGVCSSDWLFLRQKSAVIPTGIMSYC